MPAPALAAIVPLLKGLIGGLGRGALMGGLGRGALMGGRSALMTGVRAGARGGIRQGIRSGVRQGVRNTVRGGVGGRGGGGRNRGGGRDGQLAKTNDSAIVRSESGGLAVPGRTIKEGGALTSSMGPSSQKSSAIVKTGPTKDTVLGLLEQIKQTGDQILEVEVKELDNDNKEYKDTKKEQEKERKQLGSEKRDEEENKQEEKKAKKGNSKRNPVVKAAKKGLGNIFGFLLDIFKDFILYKVLGWFANPKNKKKVQSLVKFVGAIPGAIKFLWERFVEPWWEFSKNLFGGQFKIGMAMFNVVKDLITLKWLTDPGKFLNTLMEIPKKLIEVVPGIIGSLLNAITGGAVSKIGDLVSGLFNNPLKGIDLGNVGNLLGSAANFIKGLLGGAWSGLVNLTGSLLGGGNKKTDDKPKPSPPSPPQTQTQTQTASTKTLSPQAAGNLKPPVTASTKDLSPQAAGNLKPPTRAPITKTSGTEAFGDRNYGIKEGGVKTVEHDGMKYYFTRRKDGTWGIHKMWKNRRGTATVQRSVDASKVSGLVQAFDKEHGQKMDDASVSDDAGSVSRNNSSTVTSGAPRGGDNPYGMKVSSHALKYRSFAFSPGIHMGTDIGNGEYGTPLQAFTDGIITGSHPPEREANYGNWVAWKDTAGLEHFYAHMEKPTPFKKGDKVKAGTKLGTVGSTGRSTGPHLHWETSTKIGDTGGPKSTILSRIDPLTKYPLTAPFGGTTALAEGSETPPPPPQLPPPPGSTPNLGSTPSNAGKDLGSAQQESRQLSIAPRQSQQPTVINKSSSTNATHRATETFVGGTLPKSGLWAIYSFAL